MGPYVLALMFLLGGAVVARLGYANLVRTNRKRATWLACQGIVTELVEEFDADNRGKPLFAPVYRYTAGGREYTAKSGIAARPARYRVGDPIPVFVNPQKPNDSDVLDGSITLFTYGAIAIGVLVFAVGVLVFWLAASGQMKFD